MLGPKVFTGVRVHQLSRDAHAIDVASDAAHHEIADPKLASNLLHIKMRSLVLERRMLGDDEKSGEFRQAGDEVLGDAIAEIVLLRIAAHVGERKHSNRRRAFDRNARFSNGSSEQVAPTRHGFDHPLFAVTQGNSQFAYALLNRIIGHEYIWPDGLDNFILRHQTASVLDKIA